MMITLPPEIWAQVLQDATSLPDDFDLRLLRDETPDTLARQLFQPHLAVTRAIVRVCKLWDTIGTPILYESLLLSSATQFEALVSTLAPCIVHDDDDSDTAGCSGIGDEPDSRTRRRPSASWIKRIILAFHPPYHESAVSRSTLRKLFRSCPALSTLHVTTPFLLKINGPAPHVIFSLSTLFVAILSTSKTLQILNFKHDHQSFTLEHWTAFFRQMSALRYDGYMDMHQLAFIPLEFISVTADYLDDIPFIAPPVKELVLREFIDAVPIPPSIELLKRLTLTISFEMETAELQKMISSVPPSVTHLTVSHLKWADFLYIHELPRTVNHFGMGLRKLGYGNEDEDRAVYRDLVGFCESIIGDGLDTIQLVGIETCLDLRTTQPDVLGLLVETLRGRDINLVDSEGKIMGHGMRTT